MSWNDGRVKGLTAISILAFVVWLAFILFYALYWSTGYTFFQNIIVTVVSFLITGGVVGLCWWIWGSRYFPPPGSQA
jgi:hypothetical protein